MEHNLTAKTNHSFTMENKNPLQPMVMNGKEQFQALLHPENLNHYLKKRIAIHFPEFKEKIKDNPDSDNEDDEENYTFNDATYKDLSQILRISKKIQKLDIVYSVLEHMRHNEIHHISESLKNLSSLKDIQISFEISLGALRISETEMKIFFKAFKSLTSLQNLGLSFGLNQGISESGVKGLCQALKSLTGLKRIYLGIFGARISDIALKKIGRALKSLVLLENLSMRLELCRNLNGSGAQYISQALKSLPSLQNFDLSFKESEITDVAIQGLSQGFTALSDLKSLTLNLMWCSGITDEGVQNLGHGLESLVSLKDLSLNLWDCSIADTGLQSLAQGLKNLKNLNSIKIILTRCLENTNFGISQFAQVLGGLHLLENIDISLDSCKIFDKALEGLAKGLKPLISLQNINFNLSYNKITDTGVQELGDLLKNLPKLHSISLHFENCRITNLGVKSLVQSLKQLTYLQKIHFSFSYTSKIDDIGIQGIDQALKSLPSIKSINMRFYQCKVTDEAKKSLEQALKILSSSPKVKIEI